MMRVPKKTTLSGICLSVLGYRAEGEWVALALEMDLRGYGKSLKEAFEELHGLVLMQISFALVKRQPEMIWKGADPIWFDRFAEARRAQMESAITEAPLDADFQAGGLEIPPAHVISHLKNNFSRADA